MAAVAVLKKLALTVPDTLPKIAPGQADVRLCLAPGEAISVISSSSALASGKVHEIILCMPRRCGFDDGASISTNHVTAQC